MCLHVCERENEGQKSSDCGPLSDPGVFTAGSGGSGRVDCTQ